MLHDHCHHHIVYGKLSVLNMAPPPYTRRMWFYSNEPNNKREGIQKMISDCAKMIEDAK